MEQKLRSFAVICGLAESLICASSDGVVSRAESGREG